MSTLTRWTVNPIRGHGNFILTVHGFGTDTQNGGVDRHSAVFATICEISQPTGEPLDFPFIGGAGMEIRNIAPRDDGLVDLWVEVNWDSDLSIRIQLIVVND